MLFETVSAEWQVRHWTTITWGTAKSYKPPLARLNNYFTGKDIKEIRPIHIHDFVMSIVNLNYGFKTVKNHFLVAKLIFSFAVFCEYINNNPCDSVKMPRNLRKTQRTIPTPVEIDTVKNNVNAPFGLFPFMLLYTGLRKGEAIALQYKDIDRDNHVIHVTKSSYYKSNKAIIKPPKTDGGYRDVILLDLLASKLSQGEPNNYVFSADGGKTPLTAKQFIVRWRNYLACTGLNITAHQLRHAFATILYENDVSDKDAQDLLGHSSIVVTRDIYTHISKIRKAKVWEKLNKVIQ